ncbi:TonB-dependent receptor [Massilia sp. TS11]|nr:TonB-dependent receptor [Massilia sp. TS11]
MGATIIRAADIRDAGASDVGQAVRKLGGVYGRQSLDGSPDFGLDLRGFGTNSAQNMVIVLDGVRLSENELSGAILSAIPIDSVERIEIIRGGASVLYGDGATGGVIRIVTHRAKAGEASGNLRAELGQFSARDARATVLRAFDGGSFDASVARQTTDNYRANAGFRQTAFSGGVAWQLAGGRLALRLDSARQEQRFPGALSLAQFQSAPRTAQTPNDFGSHDIDRVSALYEQRIAGIDFAAELSHREKTVKATYVSAYGTTRMAYKGHQTQFSPRLRLLDSVAGGLNELVAGADFTRWDRKTDSSFSLADAEQNAQAVYLRDEFKFDRANDGRIALGLRHEVFDKTSNDPAPYTTATYSTKQSLNAWELAASYRLLPGLEGFAKAGQSYRVANADENAYTPKANVPLKGQSAHDLELGTTLGDGARSLTARWFRHRLTNEIYYDPTVNGFGANVNLDPTKRQGVEIDASAALDSEWRASAHYQHVAASFTAGPYAGREMVLVPANVLTARLTWRSGGHTADAGVQWVDSQRYGGDFANSCSAQIPSHSTLDARYARQLGPWELSLSGSNLSDKRYFSNAYGCKGGIYPSDGRQLKIAARYDF